MNRALWNATGMAVSVVLCLWLNSCTASRADAYVPLQFPPMPDRYMQFLGPDEVPIDEKYQSVYTRKGNTYIYRRFFPETYTLTSYQEYADDYLGVRHGLCEYYWDDGTLRAFGHYVNDEPHGTWEYYAAGGQLQEVGDYAAGAKSGNWTRYYPDGTPQSVAHYLEGELDSERIMYDSTGQITATDTFRRGVSIAISPDTARLYRLPLFPGCNNSRYAKRKACADKRLFEFLYGQLQYPATARKFGVTGTAVVQFTIEANGLLTEIRVLSGLCASITEELHRVVDAMPRVWEPGMQHGERVRVQFNLPVQFARP